MASTEPSISPVTIAAAAVGTVVAGFVAYAAYFDYRRRTDPEFRRQLKRASKAQAKASKVQEEQADAQRKIQIRAMVREVNEQGVPKDPEEVEKYFMDEVAEGEVLCTDPSTWMQAAMCFFRALKVYPQPGDLINIYDRTVPKPVLDILADMIAIDPTISVSGSNASAAAGTNPFAAMGGMGAFPPEEPLDD